MGINFSSLVGTASQALEKKRQRKIEDEERAQARELETLRRGLMQAQIAKLNAPPAPERPVTLSPGQGLYDPTTGQPIAERTGDMSGGFTLAPGAGRYDASGHPIAQQPAIPRDSSLRDKAQAGASTAVESIDDAERLLARNPEADVLPLGAALARGAKTSGGLVGAIAGAAEPLAQKSMTPEQQQFQADMQRMVHSMVGLLPGSRQSIVLFNSLVNAYTPQPGESAQTRSAKRAARQRARHWLAAVARGERVPVPPELSAAGITDADVTEAAPAAAPTSGRPRYRPTNPFATP